VSDVATSRERRRHSQKEGPMNGTMLWFNAAKGHGFIRTEDGERLLIEADGLAPGHILGNRCAGTRVTFERVNSAEGDPRAVGVAVVPTVEPRRARRRR